MFEETELPKMIRHWLQGLLKLSSLTITLLCTGCAVSNRGGDGAPILKSNNMTQLQKASPGEKFLIRSLVNLRGKTLILPENTTLCFEKGNIKNGRVVFRNTRLEGKVDIQGDIGGNVSNDTIYTDWFLKGATSFSKVLDQSRRLQSVFDLGAKHVFFGDGYYQCANIRIGKDVEIEGTSTIIKPVVLSQNKYRFNFLKNVFYAADAASVRIKDITFQGTLTGTILASFKSDKIYGEPLIWVNRADKVVVDGCVFRDIENCTYCNKAYNYYGKKQGSCVCLWDVSDVEYINCEQVNCRHDEQVWIIAVNEPIMDTKVTYTGNYIHDMTPGPNSSAFTCVAGTCLMEGNKVERYNYPGSMFNVFAKKAIIRNNVVKDSYCSSVFDACEYSYFHNDELLVEKNQVDAVNSVLLLGQSERVTLKNNVFRGLGLYYSANSRKTQKVTGEYTYWYSDAEGVLPTDAQTIIDGNRCDFTAYDGTRSIAGTKADYGTGTILEVARYNNIGANYGCGILIHPNEAKAGSIIITNNQFISLQSLDGVVDNNNLAGMYPYAIKLINTDSATIRGNTFNGCYQVYQNPEEYTCISVYNYPDEMEALRNPGTISREPSEYGRYIVEDNVFNVSPGVGTFYPLVVNARLNASRKTELKFKELIIRNNNLSESGTKALRATTIGAAVRRVGPVKAVREVLK